MVAFVGLCLWSRSRSGLGYVCVCGFVLVVRIGWLKAWFGLALLWAVVVGYDSGVMAGFGMILGDSFWLWDGFCGGFDSRCYVVVLVSLVVVVEGCGGDDFLNLSLSIVLVDFFVGGFVGLLNFGCFYV